MTENMKRYRSTNALNHALAYLLKTQSFDDITTTQLAKTANISRSGFYTHYKDKYDMIERYQQHILTNLESIFDKNKHDKEKTILEIFDYLNREELFAALLSQNGTREIKAYMRHKLQELLAKDPLHQFTQTQRSAIEELYMPIYISHAIFGVCQTWIARGKKESPKEVTKLLLTMLSK